MNCGSQETQRECGLHHTQELETHCTLVHIGKALDTVIAARISWPTEEYSLLPRGHLGGRKGISTKFALHSLIERIHAAWTRGKVAALLCLDISGVYNNVSHKRLLYNLRKRRIGGAVAKLIASFLKDRQTRIKLPDYLSDFLPTAPGIPISVTHLLSQLQYRPGWLG